MRLAGPALAAGVLIAGGGAAQAASLSFGLGYDDLFGQGDGAAAVGVQVATDPLWTLGPVDFGLGAAGEADTEGDLWAGGGVIAAIDVGARWRIEGSVMAGAYAFGAGEDLGSDIEFRSRLGASRAIAPPWRLGLAIEHKSNGGIGEINPGVETIFLTLSRRF